MGANFHAEAFASAFIGCGIAITIAKFAISRALEQLDELSVKVSEIAEVLAVVSVRMELLADHESAIKEHAKKIAYLEGLKNDSRIKRPLHQPYS